MKIVFVLAVIICKMAEETVTGDLAIQPGYNPFWVLEGTQFSATCVKEAPTRVALMWNVNGMDPQTMKGRGYRIRGTTVRVDSGHVRTSSRLTKELAVSDAVDFGPAIVVCETVAESEELKEQIFVSVHLFSVFTEHPNISEGEDVSLKCAPDYEDAKVIWSRDGHVIDNSSRRLVLEDRNRTLIIQKSRSQDAGMYQCSVRIPAGVKDGEHLEQTFNRNIHVSGKPYLQKETPVQVGSVINGTLTLTCPVAAFPLPEVYWLRGDDSPVLPSSRLAYAAYEGVADAKLTIANLTKQDFGVYNCVAQNSVGRLVKEFKVTVAGARSSFDFARSAVLVVSCACLVVLLGGGI
ncbi:lachesin-like [Babylonia areolata]|uniref:lachesin-like n=1 Tax=Babylonia areolata TaxID=304850 RepID=UPI003FD1657D